MSQKTDLADVILQKAGGLFRENGYAATTIKNIANAAGCTTAALYYYYGGGKAEILHEVIHSYRGREKFIDNIEGNDSISEFIAKLTSTLSQALPIMADQISWTLLQFPSLPEKEKRTLQDGIISIHASIKREVFPFIKDEAEAEKIAWLIYTMFYGYQQLFLRAEIEQVTKIDLKTFGEYVAEIVERNL